MIAVAFWLADLEGRQFNSMMVFVFAAIAATIALGVWVAVSLFKLSCMALDRCRVWRQDRTTPLPKEPTMTTMISYREFDGHEYAKQLVTRLLNKLASRVALTQDDLTGVVDELDHVAETITGKPVKRDKVCRECSSVLPPGDDVDLDTYDGLCPSCVSDATPTGLGGALESVSDRAALLRLFYIRAETDECADRSLFVWAVDPAGAVAEWRLYYDLDEADDIDYSDDPPLMMDFPSGAPAGPVAWWSGELEGFSAWGVA